MRLLEAQTLCDQIEAEFPGIRMQLIQDRLDRHIIAIFPEDRSACYIFQSPYDFEQVKIARQILNQCVAIQIVKEQAANDNNIKPENRANDRTNNL